MDDIQSKEFKRKYQKSKIKVRQWENKFVADNGRLPTKVDIKESPASVREYYKLYYKLKTQILEAQILGEDKPTEIPSQTQPVSVLKEQTNTRIRSDENPSTDSPKQNILASPLDSDTWGSHLNKTASTSAVEKEKCVLMNDVVAGRLFKGSSFKKRNPRKALSFSKKKSSKSEEVDSQDMSSILSPFSDASFDQCLNDSAFSVQNDCSPNIKALITTSASLSPLLNKCGSVKIVEEKSEPSVQPVSLVQVLGSDPLAQKPVRSIDAGWVERCNEIQNKEDRKSSSDSGFDSMEFSVREDEKGGDSSEDDVIVGSDNEAEEKKCIFVSQKRKPEGSPVVEKQPETNEGSKKLKIDEFKPETQNVAKKALLERKIQSGTLNENYVKINLKKKVFVRGKKNFNFAKYKKKQWKSKKKDLDDGRESGGLVQCYKCGETGHFSRHCQKAIEDGLLPVAEGDVDDDEDDRLPTLEEAEQMAKEKTDQKLVKRKSVFTVEKPSEETPAQPKVEPLYSLKEDGTLIETPNEVYEALEKFGHSDFRMGQEGAIMRILSGQSTLLTIATGGGKSLCYQLPAYLYAKRSNCITLVVSPLVSLMEDQVAGSSSFFKVGCLHTSQTQKQRDAVVDNAKNGKLFALLVSPETVVSGDSTGSFGSVIHQLPPIAFACIDEVHCVSQWSHNFRPSYLMISKVLREKLGITTILGLTATATVSTINSITSALRITDPRGVIKDVPLPDNLCLSVSRDENKDEALLQLLKSVKFKDANAILIYCTRRDECERLASFIRTTLQSSIHESKKISKRLSWNAESYHAGMAAARRKQVQKAFMCGNLRIVVATVAFGMGINKQDIRGVIHYNMPKDFESYVQEVGRAGRDGMLAYCHLFLDSKGRDLNELRRHIHSNSVDRHVLRKLLQRVFVPCACEKECRGHEIAFDRNDTVQNLDIPEENIYTLLCYLELHDKNFIKVLNPVYVKCRIKSYKGMKAIISAAKKCPPLAYACALSTDGKKKTSEVLEFNVVELADKLAWDSGLVKSQLKNVEWEMNENMKWRKTGIVVEFSDLGFRVCSRGNLSPSELDEALEYLTQRVENQESRSGAQLDITFSTFSHFAVDSISEDFDGKRSDDLKIAVRRYFETEDISPEIPIRKLETSDFDEEELAAEARSLLCTYRDNVFNGRAVARIFHGIQSPNYPASIWFKCRFWRKHVDKDFKKIARIATREILRLKI